MERLLQLTSVQGGAFKYKEKKTLECFMVSIYCSTFTIPRVIIYYFQ